MKIRIGTRKSPLALKQTDIVKAKLCTLYPNTEIEIVPIITTGDTILDKNLATIGGKGLFIKEIEECLQNGRIDIAVHSLKDMQAVMADKFKIACVLEREDPQDVFISTKYKSILEMPSGSIIGTSSSRRAAQALHLNPQLKIIPFRGNVSTRIKKLEEGVADATFLAAAGLNRLGIMDKSIMNIIPYTQMLPAISQGAIGIETLSDNLKMLEILAPLNHEETFACTRAERSFMRVFEGSCTTPIAAFAEISGEIHLRCLIAKPDGSIIHRTSRTGTIKDTENLGIDAALELKKTAGANFFD